MLTLTLFDSLKVSMVKFAKPFFLVNCLLEKVKYKDCHRFSEYSNQISGCMVETHCQPSDTLCRKLRPKSDLLSIDHLLYSMLTLSYRKAQKFFDGTKRINARVE